MTRTAFTTPMYRYSILRGIWLDDGTALIELIHDGEVVVSYTIADAYIYDYPAQARHITDEVLGPSGIDLSQVPDCDLHAEIARRPTSTHPGKRGRPAILSLCEKCGLSFGRLALRNHTPHCKGKGVK
jgi:hypothetical protein